MRFFLILALVAPGLVWASSYPEQGCEDRVYERQGCTGRSILLECGGYYPSIRIIDAFYGVDGQSTRQCGRNSNCPWPQTLPSATTFLQGMCDGTNPCSVNVGSPNPFPYVCNLAATAQLRVRYKCCTRGYRPDCYKKTKRIRPQINRCCKSLYPVHVGWCEGSCPNPEIEKINFLTGRKFWRRYCCHGFYKKYKITFHCSDKDIVGAESSSVMNFLKCMAECMNLSIDKIMEIYTQCGYNPWCWVKKLGPKVLECLGKCLQTTAVRSAGHIGSAWVYDVQRCDCIPCRPGRRSPATDVDTP